VSSAQAIAALGFLLLSRDTVWIGFVSLSLVAGLAAFVNPAVGASVPNLARNEDELQKASQLFGSTWGIMMTVGASLGGVFAALLGRRAAYIADVITFIIAAILFSMVKTRMQQHDTSISQRVHPIADMREAAHVARNDRVIGSLMMSKTVWAIGAGLVSQLAVLSTDVFGTGDAGIGAMVAARGVGSAVAPIIAIRMTRGDLSNILFLCGAGTVVFGPLYIGAAWIPWFIPALILITLASIGSGSQWVASTYGLQIRTPDHIRGRVIAGDFALVTLILGATSALAGVVANHLGVQWTITAFAGVSLFCALTYSAIIYPIRKELKTQYPPI
jgi:MFS family permease